MKVRVKVRENYKGCDIGYALAACSCEGAYSVDARTVTALDATTAFAVPDPGGFLAKPSVFSGLEALPVTRPG
jgi:hypothetical protein